MLQAHDSFLFLQWYDRRNSSHRIAQRLVHMPVDFPIPNLISLCHFAISETMHSWQDAFDAMQVPISTFRFSRLFSVSSHGD